MGPSGASPAFAEAAGLLVVASVAAPLSGNCAWGMAAAGNASAKPAEPQTTNPSNALKSERQILLTVKDNLLLGLLINWAIQFEQAGEQDRLLAKAGQ